VYAKQKQVIESFVRVQAFLRANPAPAPATYAGPAEVLDEPVRQLRSYAGDQVYGQQFSAAELRRQEQVMQRIVDRHIRPIVTIARAQIGQRERPARRGIARDQEQVAASLGGQIVKVQERGFVRHAVRVVHNVASVWRDLRRIGRRRCAGAGPPHRRQMRFAGSGRPGDRKREVRPARPAVDPRHRLLVRGGDQEVVALQCRPVAEIERELARHTESSS